MDISVIPESPKYQDLNVLRMTFLHVLALALIMVVAVESQGFENEPGSSLPEEGQLHHRQIRSPRLYIPNRFRSLRRRQRKPIRLATNIVMIGADNTDDNLVEATTRRTYYRYYH
ncbi:uncharacterized protein LOC131881154 [Tigriopus californicus]|uniref:uncharacterized protein LOC131881154 n=1 Tax=Tigriopus californicus TaxID=6832 RepID=UPI0027DA86E0|nr:uncharacterized protein LOC131881154 [Tigriopus californicus]